MEFMPLDFTQSSAAANNAADTASSSMKSTNPKRPLWFFQISLARRLTIAQMRPTGFSPSKAMKHCASQNSKAGFFFGSSVVISSM